MADSEPWVIVEFETGIWEWCHEHMTFEQVALARRVLGRSPQAILSESYRDPDVDTAVAVAWMARTMAGENVSLADVGGGVTGRQWVKITREVRPVDPET